VRGAEMMEAEWIADRQTKLWQ